MEWIAHRGISVGRHERESVLTRELPLSGSLFGDSHAHRILLYTKVLKRCAPPQKRTPPSIIQCSGRVKCWFYKRACASMQVYKVGSSIMWSKPLIKWAHFEWMSHRKPYRFEDANHQVVGDLLLECGPLWCFFLHLLFVRDLSMVRRSWAMGVNGMNPTLVKENILIWVDCMCSP